MAFEELKDDLSHSEQAAKDYIDSSAEYYKLKTFKFIMRAAIALTVVLFLGTLGLLAVFFLSVSLAFTIGNNLGNLAYGFGIVGGVYVLLGILGYVFRKKLEYPVLQKFSKDYFEDK
jgi:hypothetical protein